MAPCSRPLLCRISPLRRAGAPSNHLRRGGDSTMALHQRVSGAAAESTVIPADLASAAGRYQQLKETEKEHLALMARHDLQVEWSADVRETVLEARVHVRAARAAGAELRVQVRTFVCAHRGN